MFRKINISDNEKIDTDPFGCYTGRPTDPEERPIQDVDDL